MGRNQDTASGTNLNADTLIRISREAFTGLIALFILYIMWSLMLEALKYVNIPVSSATDPNVNRAYNNAKDLLLIITPFVGTVIGFYFTRAISDSRAEGAERNARTATESAQKLTDAASTQAAQAGTQAAQATAAALNAQTELNRTNQALAEVRTAAAIVAEQAAAADGSASRDLSGLAPESVGPAGVSPAALSALQAALARANAVQGGP